MQLKDRSKLTAREKQVAALLPLGATNPEIAKKLGISTRTVEVHAQRIIHKLGAKNRIAAAIKLAMEAR